MWEIQSAHGATYTTQAGSTDAAGESIDATAVFTLNNGSITVTLTNLQANPKSDAQLVTGIAFSVTGVSGTGSLTTSNTGLITTISHTGSYTSGTTDGLARWKASHSGTAVTLNLFGSGQPDHMIIDPDSQGNLDPSKLNLFGSGQPDHMIIGPDSQGNLDPSKGGHYSNANPSIYNKNPSVLGSATFTISIAGVTTTSLLSNVVFQLGTTQGSDTFNGQLVTPEPSSLAIAGLGALGLFAFGLRRRRVK
jgi:MYXO-CTERM domain-containing protein